MHAPRIILALATLLSAMVAPWWLTMALAILLLIRADAWEVVPIGLLHDLSYATPSPEFFGYPLVLTTILTAFAVVFYYGRKRFLLYTTE